MAAKRPKTITMGKVKARPERGPRADGRWYWRADRQAGPARETVWCGWGAPDEAERAIRKALDEDPAVEPEHAECRTVYDLLDYWVGSWQDSEDTPAATKSARKGAAKRLRDGLGRVQIDRLDRAALSAFRDARLRERRHRPGGAPGETVPAASSSVARDLKYLRQAWRWGREIGIVPARDLPAVSVDTKRRVYTDYTPTRAEVVGLISRTEGWVRQALVLLWATGARIGEVASLRWGAVAPDGTWVDLEGKTGPRRVALHPSVASVVAGWTRRRADDLVLGHSANRVAVEVRAQLEHLSTELDLGGRVSPHGIRRAVVDALYDAGEKPDVAAAQLGHSPATAMAHYRKVSQAQKVEAVVRARLDLPTEDGAVLPFRRERS